MKKITRPIRVEGDIAFVPLTKGYEAVIDIADIARVEGLNWCADVGPRITYAVSFDCSGEKRRKLYMHRVIMGDPDGLEVDHEDGNGLRNRRSNLRVATHGQNMRNRRTRADSSSGLKGAFWEKGKARWRAQIVLNGKRHHLGYFETPKAAHEAYCAGSAKLHCEFGRTR